MTKHSKEAERLRKIVEAFPKVTITVLGDLVADEFVYGEISRRSEEHTSELQSRPHLVWRLLLERRLYGVLRESSSNSHAYVRAATDLMRWNDPMPLALVCRSERHFLVDNIEPRGQSWGLTRRNT